MNYLDTNSNVVEWQSEEFYINYLSPIDGLMHRYYPDFAVKYKDGHIELVEVKPIKDMNPPKQINKPKKKARSINKYIKEEMTYQVNQAKFKAATIFCEQRDWQFVIITEKELYGRD